MESLVKNVAKLEKQWEEELFSLACAIFDHPEIGLEEVFAADLLTTFLEKNGFEVERGIGELSTAFRATWERGKGGPTLGFLLEYDALEGLGHACGHHLQGPTCIGAALVLRALCDLPFRIVLYGTPAEETVGGKAILEQKGFFRDVDIMFSHHTGKNTFPSCGNRALAGAEVTFFGKAAHASGAPHLGRSALDALMLAFHGLEIMREHVKDGSRIHYTITESTGPSNVVHERARAHISLRSYDRRELTLMKKRMEKILEGACLMTETQVEWEYAPEYWNIISIDSLREEILRAAELVGARRITHEKRGGGGSSDVGNVSWVVPTVLLYTYFTENKGHSSEYLLEGKEETARISMADGIKTFALTGLELIRHPEKIEEAKRLHQAAVAE